MCLQETGLARAPLAGTGGGRKGEPCPSPAEQSLCSEDGDGGERGGESGAGEGGDAGVREGTVGTSDSSSS